MFPTNSRQMLLPTKQRTHPTDTGCSRDFPEFMSPLPAVNSSTNLSSWNKETQSNKKNKHLQSALWIYKQQIPSNQTIKHPVGITNWFASELLNSPRLRTLRCSSFETRYEGIWWQLSSILPAIIPIICIYIYIYICGKNIISYIYILCWYIYISLGHCLM